MSVKKPVRLVKQGFRKAAILFTLPTGESSSWSIIARNATKNIPERRTVHIMSDVNTEGLLSGGGVRIAGATWSSRGDARAHIWDIAKRNIMVQSVWCGRKRPSLTVPVRKYRPGRRERETGKIGECSTAHVCQCLDKIFCFSEKHVTSLMYVLKRRLLIHAFLKRFRILISFDYAFSIVTPLVVSYFQVYWMPSQ